MSRPVIAQLLCVIGTLVLAGCGSSARPGPRRIYTYGATDGSTMTRPYAHGTAHCQTRQLTVRLGRSGVAAGSVAASFYLKNVARSACWLDGYPRLRLLEATGARIALHPGTSTTVPVLRPRLVWLAPGASATFHTAFADATGYANDHCPVSTQVEITPPGTDAPITVAWEVSPYGGSVQHVRCGQLAVSPVLAGIHPRP